MNWQTHEWPFPIRREMRRTVLVLLGHFSCLASNSWDCWTLLETVAPVLPAAALEGLLLSAGKERDVSYSRTRQGIESWMRARSVSQSCPTLCDPTGCSPPGSSVLVESPGKSTGVGCHALLHGIFPTLESNLTLLFGRQNSVPLSHQGSQCEFYIYIYIYIFFFFLKRSLQVGRTKNNGSETEGTHLVTGLQSLPL